MHAGIRGALVAMSAPDGLQGAGCGVRYYNQAPTL